MPTSDDRFYLLEMRNRPVCYGDIGSLMRISGVVISGGGVAAVLYLPGQLNNGFSQHIEMTIEEWSDWLHRSDNPEILVGPSANSSNATLPKIFQRKLRYEISGAVQQKVWAADGFRCYYCGAAMGKALLTVDHFDPLELGGKNDVTNFLTACKSCNKNKGSESPEAFCARWRKDANAVRAYLAQRQIS